MSARAPELHWHLERLWRTGAPRYDGAWGMVVLNAMGFRCGYVHLPDGHPWMGLDPANVPADAHGGINFAGAYPADQLDNGDGVPPGWWIGFDCGHYGDAPEPEVWPHPEEYALLWGDGHIWTTDEVADMVEFLAGQVWGAER